MNAHELRKLVNENACITWPCQSKIPELEITLANGDIDTDRIRLARCAAIRAVRLRLELRGFDCGGR